jgi:protein-disulfide isomerase
MMSFAIAAMLASSAPQPLVEGNPAAVVRVIIYEDLACSDCAVFRRMLDEKLLPRYGAKVAFEHRDFPLAKHAWARTAAIAARFWQEASPELAIALRKHLLGSIRQTTPANFNERLAAFARLHGADPQKAVAALEDPRLAGLVEKDLQEGVARGVAKTPTVFVDGAPFIETFTFEEVSKAIDAALAAAQ